MRFRKWQSQGSHSGLSDSWAVHRPEIRPQYLLWASRQGPHREKLPAYLQGTGREVKGPSPGTQALSCQLPGRGRATVHGVSTSCLSCPGGSTVDLSAAPEDTCAQGSPETAPNTGPGKQPGGLGAQTLKTQEGPQQQLRPQKAQVTLAIPVTCFMTCRLFSVQP